MVGGQLLDPNPQRLLQVAPCFGKLSQLQEGDSQIVVYVGYLGMVWSHFLQPDGQQIFQQRSRLFVASRIRQEGGVPQAKEVGVFHLQRLDKKGFSLPVISQVMEDERKICSRGGTPPNGPFMRSQNFKRSLAVLPRLLVMTQKVMNPGQHYNGVRKAVLRRVFATMSLFLYFKPLVGHFSGGFEIAHPCGADDKVHAVVPLRRVDSLVLVGDLKGPLGQLESFFELPQRVLKQP